MFSSENHLDKPWDIEFQKIIINIIKELIKFKEDTNKHPIDLKEKKDKVPTEL